MKTLPLVLALLLATFTATPRPLLAAEATSAHAILIAASNKKGGVDPRLAPYEAELRRNLPFDTFRFAGEASSPLPSSGRTQLALPTGHRLDLEGGRSGASIQLKAHWTHGSKVVLNTSLTLRPGVPAVLGRRGGDESEVPIILLFVK